MQKLSLSSILVSLTRARPGEAGQKGVGYQASRTLRELARPPSRRNHQVGGAKGNYCGCPNRELLRHFGSRRLVTHRNWSNQHVRKQVTGARRPTWRQQATPLSAKVCEIAGQRTAATGHSHTRSVQSSPASGSESQFIRASTLFDRGGASSTQR